MENQLNSGNEDLQIVNLWEKYFKYWPWFVLSVMLCCGLAVFYVKSSPKLYKRTAAVLIKDDNEQDITTAFSSRDPYRGKANVNNELEAFKSPQLTQEVVRRLNLNVNYFMQDGLRKVDLYTQSPINVIFPDSHETESFSFQTELLPDGMVVLSNFSQNDVDIQQNITTRFNVETATPFGNITISPSLYYSRNRSYLPIEVSKKDIRTVTLRYAKALNISLSSKLNTVILLEMEDASIQLAEDFLNTLISLYQENWLAEKNSATITTLSFLDERIAITEQELAEIDGRLAQFKSSNLVTDVRNAGSMQLSQSMEYSGRILEVSNQISIARFIQDYLNDNTKRSEPLPTNITGVNHPALETAIKDYNIMLAERNRLLANSSELNPIIVDRSNALQSSRQTIIQTVDNLIVTLNLQLSGLQSQEARTTRNIASNPGQERQLISIEREQNIKETLYLYLLQQREENEMALIVTATNLQVITPPSGSLDPVKPNKYLILLVALMVGGGVPIGIIWGRDLINITIRDKNDLAVLPVPLLGVIPEEKKSAKKGMLMVHYQGTGALNESFRMLRTNLGFACTPGTKVIQITSMESGSGKTFTTVNLAMSFAIVGKRVIVLDLDMRKGRLSKLIGNPDMGISDLLSKKDQQERFFIEKDYFYSGFDVMPVGPTPPNPSELLMSDELANLIEKLKNSYDYIFIDSTPVNLVVDATIVSQFADLSIFVVRENFTDRRKLSEIKNMYLGGKFKNMRVILNGSSSEVAYNRYYGKSDKDRAMLPKAVYHELAMKSSS